MENWVKTEVHQCQCRQILIESPLPAVFAWMKTFILIAVVTLNLQLGRSRTPLWVLRVDNRAAFMLYFYAYSRVRYKFRDSITIMIWQFSNYKCK